MTTEPISGLAAKASARLRRLSTNVIERRPLGAESLDFELEWLKEPVLFGKIDDVIRASHHCDGGVIYQFSATDPECYPKIVEAFGIRPPKNEKGDTLRYSRLISPLEPRALYVGSSWNLRSRVKQHLGATRGASTYAMRLALWATTVPATIRLSFWPYGPAVDPIELEALEQELWDHSAPLFGKRSGK